MRGQSRSTRMWGVTVVGLSVLWFTPSAGAAMLENWEDKIPNANQRFKVLPEFGGAAILDKETQLVREKSPASINFNWANGKIYCLATPIGGRKAWRPPSVVELSSLIDPNVVHLTLVHRTASKGAPSEGKKAAVSA